ASPICPRGSRATSRSRAPRRRRGRQEEDDMLSTTPTWSQVELPGIEPWRRGKVRAVYEADPRHLVIVASDRLSAYDHVLPTPIPQKGRVLTELSIFWFHTLKSAAPHHFVSAEPSQYPAPFDRHVE